VTWARPIRTGASFVGLGTHKHRIVFYPISHPDPETRLALINWIAEVTWDHADEKQLGGLVPIIGTEATFTSPWLTAVKGALGSDFLKNYTGMITAPSKVTPAVRAYQQAVTAVHGKEPSPWHSYLSNPFSITYYDGMVAVALAMVATHSNKPSVFNTAIPSVTNPGKGKAVVYTFAQGKAALHAGKHIQYIGATGLIDFDKWHNSFGNQEAVMSTSSLKPVSEGVVTAKQIEAVPIKGA